MDWVRVQQHVDRFKTLDKIDEQIAAAWTALYQVSGISFEEIAKRFEAPAAAVEKTVRDFAAYIELTLR